jgi:predicted RecB family nuclease
MKFEGGTVRLSATDLVGHLNCRHLTQLERQVAQGTAAPPRIWDPALAALWERGQAHEDSYIEHLVAQGLTLLKVPGVDITTEAVALTHAAMREGRDAIVQAALQSGAWVGRVDVLLRTAAPSALGEWSYEAVDTKLARETKGGTILQLSLYSDLLAGAQGTSPEHMYVVPPHAGFERERFRVAEYAAYYRVVRASLEEAVARADPTYPEPSPVCDICRWRDSCDQRRRADDHLSLVAGMSSAQRVELTGRGIPTTAALAEMPLPLPWKPERGSRESYERVREQARVQVEARTSAAPVYELLPLADGLGLARLPEPSANDIFLDFEADPYVGEHGLEYLLGYESRNASGEWVYTPLWALTRADEKAAFETFIDLVMARWADDPRLHIYHFGGYETGALKRLMGRYATREDELDRILRGLVSVDLLSVTRQSLRAGVESYSLKQLELLYRFDRETPLPAARLALNRLQLQLERGMPEAVAQPDRDVVEAYNREDCISARHLRDWLETLRAAQVEGGAIIARPVPGDPAPSENVADWIAAITPLIERLIADVPVDPNDRSAEQHGRWLLAHLLDWHRREDKAVFWEKFRLSDLTADELLDEKAALSGLEFVDVVGDTKLTPVKRYRFPPQDTDLRVGKPLLSVGGTKFGSVAAIWPEDSMVDIKTRKDTAWTHPEAVFMHEWIDPDPMQQSLLRLAIYVAEHGLEGDGPYAAARALLLRRTPTLKDGASLRTESESTLDAAQRVAVDLEPGVLPIQGPPGTGKTFTAARMICALVDRGKTVGVVANGHAVIRNLLEKVVKASDDTNIDVQCIQKPKEHEPDSHRLRIAKSAANLFAGLEDDCDVGGGTAWLWSTPEAFERVDVLFVDEAAQMSLANVLAVAQAAKRLVLIGDPQQLDQPTQGSHPDGTECSALHHLLNGEPIIAPEQGLFLEETWRLPPEICAFTSEMFYKGMLQPRAGTELQVLEGGPLSGSGLRFLAVEHTGCRSRSSAEAEAVVQLIRTLVEAAPTWTDREGKHTLTQDDILVIAPYNAQVHEIQRRLPGVKAGTVDKFQGQEEAIAIYSLTSSSAAEAPRGMEFLYSHNRLNVATSRGKCLSVLVGSPAVFEVDCRTPRQMQLANAFCRFLEIAS